MAKNAVSGLRRAITQLSTQPKWGIKPFIDCKLGVDWNGHLGCLNTHLEVGYEYVWHHHAIAYPDLTQAASSIRDSTGVNLAFHGPYVSIGTTF